MLKRKISRLRPLCLIVGIFYSSLSISAFELQEHSASYSAKIKKGVSIDGKATRTLKRLDKNKWLYSFNVDSFIADIKESSVILHDKGHIQSLDYNYKLSAFLVSDRKRKIHFDWVNNTAVNPLKKSDWEIKNIPQNTYDRLSYQLQLLLDVHNSHTKMTYFIAHKAKLRESQFVVLGEEVIQSRFGNVQSITAKKQRDEDAKRETYLWFSKDFPLLLLKMTQREKDGEEYEIVLSSAIIAGKKISWKDLVAK